MFSRLEGILDTVKGYGITALAFGGMSLVFWLILDMIFTAGICAGVFLTRNWDIIKEFVQNKTNIDI